MVTATPLEFDPTFLNYVTINLNQLNEQVRSIVSRRQVSGINEVAWALKALTLTDLTTLSGDDTKSNVSRMCQRAAFPFAPQTLKILEPSLRPRIHTAAVCVYPARVGNALAVLQNIRSSSPINIAAVATGFPTGQYPLSSRLQEIRFAIESGANEIDIVIDRSLVLQGKWSDLYRELVEMRTACVGAHMKTILAIGELGTMENVYKASMVAMLAGSDFIKTSTGKESVNATLPVGLVMINAIQSFYLKTGRKIGLKPAGGVRTVQDAIDWMILVKETLGNEWLKPELFRFGASGLLDDIEKVVKRAAD